MMEINLVIFWYKLFVTQLKPTPFYCFTFKIFFATETKW